MTGKIIWATIGSLVLLVLVIVLLLFIPEWLREALRDIAIIFLALMGIIGLLLTIALVIAAIIVVFLIKDKVIPLLEQLTLTANRVRGTTEFVSEEVVEPIISAAGTLAKLRAMSRVALNRDNT